MPAVDAIIQHGAIPSTGGMVDEPDLLVQSLTITPVREEKRYKGANKATQGILYTDPTLQFGFKAIISEKQGLADQHPGTAVAALANFTAPTTIHGFDPADGIMVYKDPSDEMDDENPDMINFTVEHFPFVEPAA